MKEKESTKEGKDSKLLTDIVEMKERGGWSISVSC